MVTAVPPAAGPVPGLAEETAGVEVGRTVKFCVDVAVPAAEVTVTGPLVAPTGTCVMTKVSVDADTGAATPLKRTVGPPAASEARA